LQRLQVESERLSTHNEEQESSLQLHKQKVNSLQESLLRKECELASLEERYKKYVEKAKSVIKILDSKQHQGSSAQSPAEMVMTRGNADGTDKRKTVDDVRSCKEMKRIKEMEDKLIMTAFYHYGLMRHRDAMDQRLAALSSGQGQSFLARQRQPTPRKVYSVYNSK
jgi:protein HOOK3